MKLINLFACFLIGSVFAFPGFDDNKIDADGANDSQDENTIIIVVGKEEIVAYKDFLFDLPYFAPYFNGNWKSADGKPLKKLYITEFENKLPIELLLNYVTFGISDDIVGDQLAPVYHAANYFLLDKKDDLFTICEKGLDKENAFEFFKAALIAEEMQFAQKCLYYLNIPELQNSSEDLETLSPDMAYVLLDFYRGILSNSDLLVFAEEYGKAFLSNEENLADTNDVLEKFKDKPVPPQIKHSKILSNLFKIDPSLGELIESLFTEDQTNLHLKSVPSSNIFKNPSRFYSILDKLNDVIRSSDQKFEGKSIRWRLMFEASQHQCSANNFHDYCDKQGPTVTFFRFEDYDKTFIAYNGESWDAPMPVSSNGAAATRRTNNESGFIVVLGKNEEITPLYRKEWINYGTVSDYSSGPIFGSIDTIFGSIDSVVEGDALASYDILIGDKCSGSQTSQFNLARNYYDSFFSVLTRKVVVSEYEVFQISASDLLN